MDFLPPELFNSLKDCTKIDLNHNRKLFNSTLFDINFLSIDNQIAGSCSVKERTLDGFYLLDANGKKVLKFSDALSSKTIIEVQTLKGKIADKAILIFLGFLNDKDLKSR